MKTNLKLLLLLLTLLSLSGFAHAQGTAISYQGRLNHAGAPATGLHDFTFNVFDVEAGGTALATTVVLAAVPVTNGLFNVSLDFGTDIFTGAKRWLEIGVRTNGSVAAYSILSPRQALTPSPYAIFATTSGTASNVVNGSVVKSLNNLRDNVMLAAGSNVTITPSGNTLTIASTGAGGNGIWSVNGNNTYYAAGNVGIGTASPLAPLDVRGNWNGEQGALNLFGDRPSVRFTGDAGSANQSWLMHLGGGPGDLLFYRRAGAEPWTPTLSLGAADGNVGIGTIAPTPGVRLEVNGATRVTTGGSGGAVHISAPNGESGLGVVGVNRFDLRFDGATLKLAVAPGIVPPPAEFGITINTNGNVGVGMASPLIASQWKLEVNGPTRLSAGGSGGAVHISAPNGESGMGIVGANRADLRFDGSSVKLVAGVGSGPPPSGNGIAINTAGNVGIGTTTPVAKLHAETSSADTAAIYGYATGPGGVGVYAQGPSGTAVYADGNARQRFDRGGFVKAMLRVDNLGGISSCFNGINNTSSGGCGFTVTKPLGGVYRINFGFPVADRFVSVTAEYASAAGFDLKRNFGVNCRVFDSTSVEVFTFWNDEAYDTFPAAFMIILY